VLTKKLVATCGLPWRRHWSSVGQAMVSCMAERQRRKAVKPTTHSSVRASFSGPYNFITCYREELSKPAPFLSDSVGFLGLRALSEALFRGRGP